MENIDRLRVSIFTSAHDARFLADAYRSIKDQAFDEWVLVLDGVSWEAAPEEARSDSRVIIYEAPDWEALGLTTSINGKTLPNVGAIHQFAAAQCTGDILVKLDHDDMLAPSTVAMVRPWFDDPDVVLVHTNLAQFFWPSMKPRTWGWKTRPIYLTDALGSWPLEESVWPDPTADNVAGLQTQPSHALAIRRTAYGKVGGFDPKMAVCEDFDLKCRLFLAGKFVRADFCGAFQRRLDDGSNACSVRQEETVRVGDAIRAKYLPAMLEVEKKRAGHDITPEKIRQLVRDAPDGNRADLLVMACAQAHANRVTGGLWCEFGVAAGVSIKLIADHVSEVVHGFDSFEGLPEPWNGFSVGQFTERGQPPAVPQNVQLHKGLFAETVPAFATEHSGPLAFLHMDADLYSSTKTVFDLLGDRIVAGTVVVFDELVGYPDWQYHEFRAFRELVQQRALDFAVIGAAHHAEQVAVLITRVGDGPSLVDERVKPPTQQGPAVTASGCVRFRFHVLGAGPHTQTNRDWSPCAFTQNSRNWIRMMTARGHDVIHYGNEGSDVPCELVQIFSDADRKRHYGTIDHNQLYDDCWSKEKGKKAYAEWNRRAIDALKPRIRKGDFIIGWQGDTNKQIAEAFPGSWDGSGPVRFVEAAIGNYCAFSAYRVYASHGLRELYHGAGKGRLDQYSDVVIPHFFDPNDFALDAEPISDRMASAIAVPYYLFVGRIKEDKGYWTAVRAAEALGYRLILAGQGTPGRVLPSRVLQWGYCTLEERRVLLANCIAVYVPTQYREPFGMVAVEAQLSGRPAITTDFGAFPETVEDAWRCTGLREFVEAGKRAQELTRLDRERLRQRAIERYSLDAVAPQYERYFGRLHSRWGNGWDELRDPTQIPIPA